MNSLTPHPLDGIRIKIQRAYEHIQNLDSWIESFKANPYKVAFKNYPAQDRRQYDLHIGSGENEGLRLIALRSGQIIHHLRSSFDHLVWQLIERNGVDPGTLKGKD